MMRIKAVHGTGAAFPYIQIGLISLLFFSCSSKSGFWAVLRPVCIFESGSLLKSIVQGAASCPQMSETLPCLRVVLEQKLSKIFENDLCHEINLTLCPNVLKCMHMHTLSHIYALYFDIFYQQNRNTLV